MEEKIFYSPTINSTELLRTLSIYGVPCFGERFLNMNELLDAANIKLGYVIKNKILSSNEMEEKILSIFVNNIKITNPKYQDLTHFLSTLNNIRMHISDSDENNKINDVVSKYNDSLSVNLLSQFVNLYFEILGKDLDTISYAHKLIEYCNSNNKKAFNKIYYFSECKLKPLEETLLKALAGEIIEVSLLSYFSNNTQKKEVDIAPRYGIRNEVAHVLHDIMEKGYKQDECQIVLTNTSSYVNELFKLSKAHNIKLTYECGLPINITDAYKLYKTLNQLDSKYFYDVNGYINLFSSESLDLDKLKINHPIQVAQLLGRMKINFDKTNNDKCMQNLDNLLNNHPKEFKLFLEKIDRDLKNQSEEIILEAKHIVEELSKGISYIIENYVKDGIFDKKLFESSISFICDALKYASINVPEDLRDSYLSSIDSKYVGHEVFSDEAIHVTTINKALSTVRKHVYVIGLNSAYYPGSLTEDFLFNDNLYKELCGIQNITETSLNDKNEFLRNLINLYIKSGSEVYLSYNAQEIKEVRELNPCSVLLEFIEQKYTEKEFNKLKSICSYYDDKLSPFYDVVEIVRKNNTIKKEELVVEQKPYDGEDYLGRKLLDRSYSPSTLPSFLKCPLRFYLDNIMHANEKIDYDPFHPIAGNRFGDLFHYVMQIFLTNHRDYTPQQIKDLANEIYDLYVSFDRSISDDNIERKPFLNSVENAYHFIKNNFDLSDKNDIHCELGVGYGDEYSRAKIGNIHFHGSIDLVIKDKNGEMVVVDYKTGRYIDHENNDVKSCIQGLIYAKLYELVYNVKISKLYFYYSRYDKVITFANPSSSDNDLLNKVNLFEDCLKNLDFKIANEEDFDEVCRYCKYENICKKEGK